MFHKAETAIQEQTMRNMLASAMQKLREEEELRAIFKGEHLQAELKCLQEGYYVKSREKAEKKNKFLETGMIVTTAEVGVHFASALEQWWGEPLGQ